MQWYPSDFIIYTFVTELAQSQWSKNIFISHSNCKLFFFFSLSLLFRCHARRNKVHISSQCECRMPSNTPLKSSNNQWTHLKITQNETKIHWNNKQDFFFFSQTSNNSEIDSIKIQTWRRGWRFIDFLILSSADRVVISIYFFFLRGFRAGIRGRGWIRIRCALVAMILLEEPPLYHPFLRRRSPPCVPATSVAAAAAAM